MAGVLNYALSVNTRGFTGPLGMASRTLRGFTGGISSLAGKLTSLPALLAAGAGGVGILGTAFKAFKVAADMESTIVSFSTLMGSTEKAKDLIAELNRQAESTPYALDDLAQSARSLLAVSDDKNLIADLRMIGDLASASQKPITDLASMYAKIKGGDIVQAEDLNMIGDALGGKALQEFANVLGVDSVKAVRKLGSEGKISGVILDQVFRNLTKEGGIAFGAMSAQSKTTNGLLSTLKDNLTSILRTLGEPINDLMKPILAGWIERAKDFGTQLSGVIGLLQSAAKDGGLGQMVGAGLLLGAVKFINTLSGGIQGSIAYLATALPKALVDVGNILFNDNTVEAITLAFQSAGTLIESAGLRAAASIFKAFGATGRADNLTSEANTNDAVAGFNFREAIPEILSRNDMGKMAEESGAAIIAAHKAGAEAAAELFAEDLIDERPFSEAAKDIGNALNPIALDKIINPKSYRPDAPKEAVRGDVGGLAKARADLNRPGKREAQKDADDVAERSRNAADFATEQAILDARLAGNEKLAAALDRQWRLEKLKLQIMREQGLAAGQAGAMAEKRIKAEEDINDPKHRRRARGAEESARRRFGRMSEADQEKAGGFEGFLRKNNTDRLAVLAERRRKANQAGEAAAAPPPKPGAAKADNKELVKNTGKILDKLDKIGTATL